MKIKLHSFSFIVSTLLLFFFPLVCFAAVATTDFSGNWSGYFYAKGFSGRYSIDISIDQSGAEILNTSTYTSGSTVGTFSGSVTSNELSVDFSHQDGDCTIKGDAKATITDNVLTFIANAYDCDHKKYTVRGAAVKEGWTEYPHDTWINVSKTKRPSGLVVGHFWAGIDDDDENISDISIITPTGAEIKGFEVEEGSTSPKEWDFSYAIPRINMETVWPNGVYVWNVLLDDTSRRYYFAVLVGDYPNQYPELITPAFGEEINPNDDYEFIWKPWVNSSSETGRIYFGLTKDCCSDDTTTSKIVPAGILAADKIYRFDMNFHYNSNYRAAKNCEADFLFRTGPHMVEEHWLGKIQIKEDNGDSISGILLGMLEGLSIKSVLLKKGSATIGEMNQNNQGDGSWEILLQEDDWATFDTMYPDGNYSYEVTYVDDTTEILPITITGEYPSVFPDITRPAPGEKIDMTKGYSTAWADDWDGYGVNDNQVFACVSLRDSSDQFVSATEETWGTSEGDLQSGVFMPPGILLNKKNYYFLVMYINREDGNPAAKVTARAVSIQGDAPHVESFPWHSFLTTVIIPQK